jgi:hypothetical protein
MMELENRLQRMLDRQDIHDVIVTYCRAIDRLDAGLFASMFWEDGGYSTASGAVVRAAEPAFVQNILDDTMRRSYSQTQHFISNVRFDFDGADVANTEAYLHAFHRSYTSGERLESIVGKSQLTDRALDPAIRYDIVVAGRYLDRFERRRGAWKISTRRLILDWTSIMPSTEWGTADSAVGGFCWLGERGPSDPSYPIPRQAG